MNLENLNLVELNAQEVKVVDGGFIHIGPRSVGPDAIVKGAKAILGFLAGIGDGIRAGM